MILQVRPVYVYRLFKIIAAGSLLTVAQAGSAAVNESIDRQTSQHPLSWSLTKNGVNTSLGKVVMAGGEPTVVFVCTADTPMLQAALQELVTLTPRYRVVIIRIGDLNQFVPGLFADPRLAENLYSGILPPNDTIILPKVLAVGQGGRVVADMNGWGAGHSLISFLKEPQTDLRAATSINLMDLWQKRNPTFPRSPKLEPLPRRGLLAEYLFNNNAMDTSGNAHHGRAYQVKPAADRFGSRNAAFEFDGKGSFVDIGSFSIGGPFSVSGWVMYRSFRDKSRIFDFDGFGMWLNPERNRLEMQVHGEDGRIIDAVVNGVPWNIWLFWCVTDSASGDMVTYRNGVIDQHIHNGIPVPLKRRSRQLFGQTPHPNADRYLHGILDDVRIWNRVLTAAEVEALYREGGWKGRVY